MKFRHRIPNLYYSVTANIQNDRFEVEVETIEKKFPEYNVITSNGMFKNEEEWAEKIESAISGSDVIVFSFPEQWEDGHFFNERFEQELTLAQKMKKVVCIVRGMEIGLVSDRKWVNRPIH